MRIDLHFTPQQTDEQSLRVKSVVVIDVLRASTTIITALSNGAREFIPVTTVESAVKISGNLFGEVILLGGERNGKIIQGFSLGNSPFEYTEEKVKGKSIIFSSSNGSLALAKAHYARELMVCGFVNISSVVAALTQYPREFTIVCAGNNSLFSLEDAVCAGMLVSGVVDKNPDLVLSDGARAALILFKGLGKNILRMIKGSDHGTYLQEIGFGEDLKVCAGIDTLPVIPQLEGNVIKLRREAERKEVPQAAGPTE